METKTLIVSPSMFDKLELQLRAKVQVDGVDERAVLFDEHVVFDDGCTMEIVAANSPSGPYVLGVDNECWFTEKRYSLAGDYTVKEHCVKVERSIKAFPVCPRCGNDMKEMGTVGVIEQAGEWDAEVERFDCPEGHTILVLETERIDDENEYCKECRVEHHDTCSMTDGCPCCEMTKRQQV